MPRSKRTLQERIVDADIKCRRALADATDAKEAGKKKKAERLEDRAQYWLDEQNRLEDKRYEHLSSSICGPVPKQ